MTRLGVYAGGLSVLAAPPLLNSWRAWWTGAPPGVSRVLAPRFGPRPPGAFRCGKGLWVAVAVHERSVWDRYATRRLYELLAEWRPARGSEAWRRQTMVTAALDELHPQARVVRHSVGARRVEIRGRVA
jgi:hypothetical protein